MTDGIDVVDRWFFSKEQLKRSPSIIDGIEYTKEIYYRQQCTSLIQEIGQRLRINQLTINTAIVYIQRFYMFHSFKKFHRFSMAPCCIFLSCKVEEQPRKLEHIIMATHFSLTKDSKELSTLTANSEEYQRLSNELVENETILLLTLGFDIDIEHPHTHVVKWSNFLKVSKELAQTSYFLATNSLHLTCFCILHKPSTVACVCINIACKWSQYQLSGDNDKPWWWCIDSCLKKEELESLTSYFLKILDTCPSKLKKILMGYSETNDKKATLNSDVPIKRKILDNGDSSINKKSKDIDTNSIATSNTNQTISTFDQF